MGTIISLLCAMTAATVVFWRQHHVSNTEPNLSHGQNYDYKQCFRMWTWSLHRSLWCRACANVPFKPIIFGSAPAGLFSLGLAKNILLGPYAYFDKGLWLMLVCLAWLCWATGAILCSVFYHAIRMYMLQIRLSPPTKPPPAADPWQDFDNIRPHKVLLEAEARRQREDADPHRKNLTRLARAVDRSTRNERTELSQVSPSDPRHPRARDSSFQRWWTDQENESLRRQRAGETPQLHLL